VRSVDFSHRPGKMPGTPAGVPVKNSNHARWDFSQSPSAFPGFGDAHIYLPAGYAGAWELGKLVLAEKTCFRGLHAALTQLASSNDFAYEEHLVHAEREGRAVTTFRPGALAPAGSVRCATRPAPARPTRATPGPHVELLFKTRTCRTAPVRAASSCAWPPLSGPRSGPRPS